MRKALIIDNRVHQIWPWPPKNKPLPLLSPMMMNGDTEEKAAENKRKFRPEFGGVHDVPDDVCPGWLWDPDTKTAYAPPPKVARTKVDPMITFLAEKFDMTIEDVARRLRPDKFKKKPKGRQKKK